MLTIPFKGYILYKTAPGEIKVIAIFLHKAVIIATNIVKNQDGQDISSSVNMLPQVPLILTNVI